VRARAEWDDTGKDERFLLDPGAQLERGRDLLRDPGDVPVDDFRDFVERSIMREEHRLAAEREATLAQPERIAEAEREANKLREAVLAYADSSCQRIKLYE
jgi:hypothetical protein